ncbi:MAG: hypothetical protein E6534_06760, partial [Corynebacterium kroppenstedtii]|nr:hypothetical protein [Corynebacterium kroppenstedtii]
LSPTIPTALVSTAEWGSAAPASNLESAPIQVAAQNPARAMRQGWLPFAASGTDVCAQVKP